MVVLNKHYNKENEKKSLVIASPSIINTNIPSATSSGLLVGRVIFLVPSWHLGLEPQSICSSKNDLHKRMNLFLKNQVVTCTPNSPKSGCNYNKDQF
jgi:hypothetical protein